MPRHTPASAFFGHFENGSVRARHQRQIIGPNAEAFDHHPPFLIRRSIHRRITITIAAEEPFNVCSAPCTGQARCELHGQADGVALIARIDASGLELIPLNMAEPILTVCGLNPENGLGFSPAAPVGISAVRIRCAGMLAKQKWRCLRWRRLGSKRLFLASLTFPNGGTKKRLAFTDLSTARAGFFFRYYAKCSHAYCIVTGG
jgi:hypothetical protein